MLWPKSFFSVLPSSIAVSFAIAYGEFVGSRDPPIKLSSVIGLGAFKGYMQLLPKLIKDILGKSTIDSKMFIFIFKFSIKKEVPWVSLA